MNAYGELDHQFASEGQQHQGQVPTKRMKKPKDIYALRNQIPQNRVKNHQVEQLQLVNCNKQDQIDLARSVGRPGGRGRDRYNPAYDGFDERQEAEYQAESIPQKYLYQASDHNNQGQIERSSPRTGGMITQ